MQRGKLVDILFENTQNSSQTNRTANIQSQDKQAIRRQYENVFHKAQTFSRPSNMIKITQFNSSLVIGDQKIIQKGTNFSFSASPHKNFNIKKVAELKNNIAITAQKIVNIQLKKKQKISHLQLNKFFTHENSKEPMSKMLVTTRCSIKEVPNIESLTFGIIVDEKIRASQQIIDQTLSYHHNNTQKKYLKHSKQIFNCISQNDKSQPQKKGSDKKIEYLDFPSKTDDFEIRKNTGSPRRHYSRHIQQQKKYQQKVERQKKEMLQMKKELNKTYAKPFNPPENISAYSYIIYETDAKKSKFLRKMSSLKRDENPEWYQTKKILLNSHKVIVASNSRSSVQIASLTKIMTCVLALDLSKKYGKYLSEEFVTIGAFEHDIGGTSADIKKGEIYSIEQLLYGLMLPSGNDASLAIAVWGGKLLLQKQSLGKDSLGSTACSSSGNVLNSYKKRDCYERFIAQMNSKAIDLNMEKTKYANSHGLSDSQNRSCAYDLAILCEYAMNIRQFREVVSCKAYETVVNISNISCEQAAKLSHQSSSKQNQYQLSRNYSEDNNLEGVMQFQEMKDLEEGNPDCNNEQMADDKDNSGSLAKTIRWQNTHHLLQTRPNLYVGIKTGITSTAGPCLSSCLEMNGKRYIIIVLNCKTMKLRFKDTENLRKWLCNKQQKIRSRDQIKISPEKDIVSQRTKEECGQI